MKAGNFIRIPFMLRIAKLLFGAVIAVVACERASAFSLQGIAYTWQTTDMDYFSFLGPRNLGDEYRVNTAIVTYGFDSSFLDYFGEEGVKAVDEAFRVFNRLPPVSQMSSNLDEYMTEGNMNINHRASALYLLDMKTAVMNSICGYLGLGGSEHVFDLRHRWSTPVTCEFTYETVIRNFDPITWNPSKYVNGTLYTYHIEDTCAVADAVEETVGGPYPDSRPLASGMNIFYGTYALGITRDDAGGLRYIYRKSNFNNEILPGDALVSSISDSPWNTVSTNTTVVSGDSSSPWNTVTPTTNYSTTFTATRTALFASFALASTNTAGIRGGVEKVTFVKMYYDSLMGTNFRPVSLTYSIPTVKNYKSVYQKVNRIVTVPDILISAADLGQFGTDFYDADYYQAWFFVGASAAAAAGTDNGPGVFDPRASIVFNKVGKTFVNTGIANNIFFIPGSGGLREANSSTWHAWASFDGTTNDPVIYPSGQSIREIERQIYTDPGVPSGINQ